MKQSMLTRGSVVQNLNNIFNALAPQTPQNSATNPAGGHVVINHQLTTPPALQIHTPGAPDHITTVGVIANPFTTPLAHQQQTPDSQNYLLNLVAITNPSIITPIINQRHLPLAAEGERIDITPFTLTPQDPNQDFDNNYSSSSSSSSNRSIGLNTGFIKYNSDDDTTTSPLSIASNYSVLGQPHGNSPFSVSPAVSSINPSKRKNSYDSDEDSDEDNSEYSSKFSRTDSNNYDDSLDLEDVLSTYFGYTTPRNTNNDDNSLLDPNLEYAEISPYFSSTYPQNTNNNHDDDLNPEDNNQNSAGNDQNSEENSSNSYDYFNNWGL